MNYYKKSKKENNFFNSVVFALEGVVHTLQSERNMRFHFIGGFLDLIIAVYFNITGIEFMILSITITFVLVAEMFNTAMENIVDLIKKDYNKLAKIAKDIAAGAVFVSSINACIVGYILLYKRVEKCFKTGFFLIKQSSWHLTIIILIIIIGLVLFIKIKGKEKNLLKGGMPSGHTAVVFSIWIIVSLITKHSLVCFLTLFLAILVAKSRIKNKIHTYWEVFVGGVLGVLVTLLVWQLLPLH